MLSRIFLGVRKQRVRETHLAAELVMRTLVSSTIRWISEPYAGCSRAHSASSCLAFASICAALTGLGAERACFCGAGAGGASLATSGGSSSESDSTIRRLLWTLLGPHQLRFPLADDALTGTRHRHIGTAAKPANALTEVGRAQRLLSDLPQTRACIHTRISTHDKGWRSEDRPSARRFPRQEAR